MKNSATSPISRLKLVKHLDDIAEVIAKNDWTHIQAPTGSGKSLGIPFKIASNFCQPRVVVSVPTITAVQSLHRTFKLWWPGIPSGYSAEGKVCYDNSTKVIYATSGHVLHLMLSSYSRRICDFCDVLILDEVHNRSIENYVIMELWKRCTSHYENDGRSYVKFAQRPRFVTMSADFDGSLFPLAKSYVVDIPQYTIDVKYHGSEVHHHKLVDTLARVIAEHDISSPSPESNHFLVFVHGVDTVHKLVRTLSLKTSAHVLPAYGGMSDLQLKRIYDAPPSGKRKIIVATNVAETSITIEGVSIVFDGMYEKVPVETDVGSVKLVTSSISKASANQRKGRTGRTMPGLCYRLTSKELFDKYTNTREDEIHRCSIHTTVLQLVCCYIDPYTFLYLASKERVKASLVLLERLGLIKEKIISSDEYNPTKSGKFVSRLPLDVRTGTLIYLWTKVLKLPPLPVIVVASFVDRADGSYFAISSSSLSGDTGPNDDLAPFSSYSDIGTYLHLFLHLMNECNGSILSDSSTLLNIFTCMSFVKARPLVNAFLAIARLVDMLKLKDGDIGPFDVNKVIEKLSPILSFVYDDRRMSNVKGHSDKGNMTSCTYRLVKEIPDEEESSKCKDQTPTFTLERKTLATCIRKNSLLIVSLCSIEINNVNVISISAPITEDDITKGNEIKDAYYKSVIRLGGHKRDVPESTRNHKSPRLDVAKVEEEKAPRGVVYVKPEAPTMVEEIVRQPEAPVFKSDFKSTFEWIE